MRSMGKLPGARPICVASPTNGWTVPGIRTTTPLCGRSTMRGPTWAPRVLVNASERNRRETKNAALLDGLRGMVRAPMRDRRETLAVPPECGLTLDNSYWSPDGTGSTAPLVTLSARPAEIRAISFEDRSQHCHRRGRIERGVTPAVAGHKAERALVFGGTAHI